jgi:hypothetical protein
MQCWEGMGDRHGDSREDQRGELSSCCVSLEQHVVRLQITQRRTLETDEALLSSRCASLLLYVKGRIAEKDGAAQCYLSSPAMVPDKLYIYFAALLRFPSLP